MEEQKHLVVFQPSGRQGHIAQGTSLLEAARQLGVDVDSICGGRQTCGKCKVLVEQGEFVKYGITSSPAHLSPADATEQHYFERKGQLLESGARLSCAACVLSDVLATVPPESTSRKQVVRKSASERAIEIDPILRRVFVAVQPHELGARDGDWERLQHALKAEWQLENVTIDLHALRQLSPALKAGKHSVTVTVWNEHEVIDVRGGYHEGLFGLAVDVGSTTIAAHLCDLRTGAVLNTQSSMNPQVTYGEDLMSRVSYAMMHDDGLQKMHAAVIGTLNQLIDRAAETAKINREDICEAVLVGNTVMHHILLGLDPIELGAAPFTLATHAALNIKARELNLRIHPAGNVHLMALEAGHVGADNLAAIVSEAPDQRDELTLLIDIGTNAEIVLGNKQGLWSCSSPTGPALEGGQIAHGQRAAAGAIERVRIDKATGVPRFRVIGNELWSDEQPDDNVKATGICGSGIIEVVAELFMAGVLKPDGRFNSLSSELSDNANLHRLRWNGPKAEYVLATAEQTLTGKEIVVTQDDIRNIQLAKAALYAGCKLLMNGLGVNAVDRIVLAGAFGSYIDPMHAMVLGLYPNCDLQHVNAVGNAAGDGARMVLLNKSIREKSAHTAREVHYIETAIDPNFQAEFVGAMHLPHMTDTFAALDALNVLPAKEAKQEDERAKRRRERRERVA